MKIKNYKEFLNESKRYSSKEEIISDLRKFQILDKNTPDDAISSFVDISDDLEITWKQDLIMEHSNFPNKCIPIKIHKVNGTFSIKNSSNIFSLKNSPDWVKNDFECNNTEITSLKGAPEYVGGGFYCGWTNITSLEFAPIFVKSFDCNKCNIKSLEHFPKKLIHNNVDFNIISLEACGLSNLIGLPDDLDMTLWLNKNLFETLDGLPNKFDLNEIRFSSHNFNDSTYIRENKEKAHILSNSNAICLYIDKQLELDLNLFSFYKYHYDIVKEQQKWLKDKWDYLYEIESYNV